MENLKSILNSKKTNIKGPILLKEKHQEEIAKKSEEISKLEAERKERLKRKLQFYEEEERKVAKKLKSEVQPLEVLEVSVPEPPLSKSEVIEKLRERKQPATFFGETDWDRYRRLASLIEKKCHQDMKRDDVLISEKVKNDKFFALKKATEGDDFDKDLLRKFAENDARFKPELEFFPEFRQKKPVVIDLKVAYEDKCDDVYIFIKTLLAKWRERVEEIQKKEETKVYEECCEYANPLYHLLNQRVNFFIQKLNPEVLNFLYYIVHFCSRREYVKASNKYMELSIGNAPWPMGITMVGIHERSGKQRQKSPYTACKILLFRHIE